MHRFGQLSMLQLWFVANTLLWSFSIELGGLKLGLNVVLLSIAGLGWFASVRRVSRLSAKATAILCVYFVFSWVLALSGPCMDQFVKAALTVPILLLLVLIGLEVGRKARDADWIGLEKPAAGALFAAFIGFAVEAILPQFFPLQAGYRFQGKYSGMFREPSHVGFSLFPCIVVLLVSSKKESRRIGIAGLMGLVIISRSSTLVAMIAAWLLYRLVVRRKVRQVAVFVVWAAIFIGGASAVNFNGLVLPTVQRIAGIGSSGETSNTSSLVYVQGWEDAWANLARSRGRGLGPNMMGCSPLPQVPARAVLALMASSDSLNAEDGSFLFSKIVSETGIVGILMYGMIFLWWIRLERQLRMEKDRTHHFAIATRSALIFCFIASSFIRSAGYFSGGLLLWLAAASERPGHQPEQVTQPSAPPLSFSRPNERTI